MGRLPSSSSLHMRRPRAISAVAFLTCCLAANECKSAARSSLAEAQASKSVRHRLRSESCGVHQELLGKWEPPLGARSGKGRHLGSSWAPFLFALKASQPAFLPELLAEASRGSTGAEIRKTMSCGGSHVVAVGLIFRCAMATGDITPRESLIRMTSQRKSMMKTGELPLLRTRVKHAEVMHVNDRNEHALHGHCATKSLFGGCRCRWTG